MALKNRLIFISNHALKNFVGHEHFRRNVTREHRQVRDPVLHGTEEVSVRQYSEKKST